MIWLSFLIAYLFLVPTQVPSTTDWRGLAPLKSTRMDVERTLGPPDKTIDNQVMTYYLPDIVVFFEFSSNLKCARKLPYTSWDVTADTVTGIKIQLRRQPLVEETDIDLSKLKKIQGNYDLIGHYYYSNSDDGFAIEVGKNHVMGYLYSPGSKHHNLLCEPIKQPQDPQDARTKHHNDTGSMKIDQYGFIPFKAEKVRLDEFATTLSGWTGARGYIIVYPGRTKTAKEAQARANRAQSYLVAKKELRNRIRAIIGGGGRKEPSVELFITVKNGLPPEVEPLKN